MLASQLSIQTHSFLFNRAYRGSLMTNAEWCINSSIYRQITRIATCKHKPRRKRHEWKGSNGLAFRKAYLQPHCTSRLYRPGDSIHIIIFSLFHLISLYNVIQCVKLCNDVETTLRIKCKGVSKLQNYLNLIIISIFFFLLDSSLNIKLFGGKFSNKILLVTHHFL